MKKLVLILFVLIISSCINGVSKKIPLKKGDTRITITDKHVIHEKCSGFDNFGTPHWEFEYIESRCEYEWKLKQDSIIK